MSDKRKKDQKLLDGLFHELGALDAESGPETAAEKQAVDELEIAARKALKDAKQARLKEARAARLADEQQSRMSKILAMTRDAVVSRLEALQVMFPGELALEHRKLDELPDEDLRSLLLDLEEQLEERQAAEGSDSDSTDQGE